MTHSEHWFASHVREIDREECLELLAEVSVGRIAYCDHDGPVVLPVNHIVDGEDICFAVSPHSELAGHLRSGRASFQVDDTDDYTQTGWSVLVRGTVQPTSFEELGDNRPEPWAEGTRTFLVRLVPDQITGRRLLEA